MPNSTSTNTVLIIDDDNAIRKLFSLLLKNHHYQVLQGASRMAAIKQIEAHKEIGVILLDLGMPPAEHNMSEGLEVLKYIEKNSLSIKTIVLTGQDAQQAAYQSIAHGAFDFLAKPITETALISAIERAFLFLDQEKQYAQQSEQRKLTINIPLGKGLKDVRNSAEEKLVRQVLDETQFNVHESARKLGIKRENIYYLMNKYRIERNA